MPIYEYSCRKCGQDFEELVFGDTPPLCPHCGSSDTAKLMSCCAHHSGGGSDAAPSAPPSGGGCGGCSGGNCAACGH